MSRGIPKTIKLGETEFTISDYPELLALIEAGRTEEKSKLYAQIEKAENDLKALKEEQVKLTTLSSTDKAELEKANKALTEAMAELEEFKTNKDNNTMNQEEIQKLIKENLAEATKESTSKIEELQKQIRERDLADYRRRQIEANKDVIIPEFVNGSFADESEIDKAIEEAKAKSANYITQDFKFGDGTTKKMTLSEIANLSEEDRKGSGTPPITPTQTTNPSQSVPVPPASSGEPASLLDSLATMSDAEYAKNRETIKQELQKMSYVG